MTQAIADTQVDNEQVRVTRWTFAPGASTGWHVHEMPYVITPVVGSQVRIIDADGNATEVEMIAGQSYFRPSGIAHDVINAGPGDLVFVETELKDTP